MKETGFRTWKLEKEDKDILGSNEISIINWIHRKVQEVMLHSDKY